MVQIGQQADLLNWEPPTPVERFDDDQVRAASIAGRMCRAVSLSLKDSGHDRATIAEMMGDFLGEEVSKNMLDAYSSQAREEHVINVVRFIALIHATKDRRLLEMVAEMFGWTVIERRYLQLIELASLNEHRDELRQRAEAVRRRAKSKGLL